MKCIFPCVIEKANDLFCLSFPDFEDRHICNVDLYDAVKAAHNVLLLEVYLKENQRLVIPDASDIQDVLKNLKENQIVTYITCDTDALSDALDLYDNIQTEDLQQFLNDKQEEYEAYQASIPEQEVVVGQGDDKSSGEADSNETASETLTDTTDFVDDIEVIKKEETELSEKQNEEKTTKTDNTTTEKVSNAAVRQKPKRRYNKPPKRNGSKSS